jgi:tetratricopeptide (TPR) repeat protein
MQYHRYKKSQELFQLLADLPIRRSARRNWSPRLRADFPDGSLAEAGWRVYCKGSLEADGYFREALLAHLAEDSQSDKLVKVLLDSHLVDSFWYNDNRVEWQRHVSRLSHSLSLSKLVNDWLSERDSQQRLTAGDAVVAGKLCRLFQEIGAFDESMALGQAALRIWRKNNVENSPEMVGTYLAVGDIQSKREQLDNAAESHERALEIASRAYAPDSPDMADVLYRLCVFYTKSKRNYKKASAYLDKCYPIYEHCSPPNLVGMANCINDRAVIYTAEQRSADKLALYQEALSLFERATPRGHPEMVSTLSNVAFELIQENKLSEALPYLSRAVDMAEVVLLPQHEYTEYARSLLCSTLMCLGQDDKALAVMRQHVEEHERYPGKNHVDTAYARLAYCSALWRAVLTAEASVDSPHRREMHHQCQLIFRARAQTIVGLLDLAEESRKASEIGLYRCLREAVQRTCQSEPEPGASDDQSGALPAACYGQIVELVLSDQPMTKIGPTILSIWQREAPKLEQRADLLPQTRKAITYLLAWYGRVCLGKSDDLESVREAFDLITQIGADSPETLDNLASLTITLHHRRLDETSETLCQLLLERAERILGSEHVQTYTYLGNLAFLKMYRNKFEEASSLFQRALQTHLRESGHDDFGSISAVAQVAECLLMQDRTDEARQLICDFAEKLPEADGQTSPRKTLAEVLNAAGIRQKNEFARYEAARTCYELSLEFNPDQAVIHSNFALLLWACLDACDEADRHFRRSLEINDRSYNTHSIYGLFLGQTRKDFKRAIEHFESAAKVNRDDAGTLSNHASVLLVCGEAQVAWRLAKRAMRLCQPHPDRIMSRALFNGAAAMLLLGKDPSLPLGQLKTLFAHRIDHAPWIITALLKKLQDELTPDSFALVKAASAAIDNSQQLARLEEVHAWQSIESQSLDISWPEI